MRISNAMVTRQSQSRLQAGLAGVDRLREDISSGLRLRRISDDPTSGAEVVRVGSSMRAITQFRRNIDLGVSRATTEEGVLDQLTNVITRASELGVNASNGTQTAQTRTIIKAEIDQLLGFAAQLGNTRFGEGYLFGGTRQGEAPFTVPPPATGTFSALTLSGNPVDPTGVTTLEIGDNKFVTPTHDGKQVFLDTDALDALRALSDALGANNVGQIGAAVTRLNTSLSNVQSLIGTQGARINEMEDAKARLTQTEHELLAYRSDLRDTEVDKALAELVGKQTLYQAAMGATARILGMSLASYL
ncbi:MAG: flagellar hook-associated protein FlgL [Gemmatimonadetes bacterium]|nr:flagellar hook-associated protein FlgL [Gemmatimonadota bacterium]